MVDSLHTPPIIPSPLPATHPWPCNPCCQLKCRTSGFFLGTKKRDSLRLGIEIALPKLSISAPFYRNDRCWPLKKGNVNSGNHVIPCLWSNLTLPLNSKCPNQASKCPNQAGKPWRSAKRVFLDKVLKHAKAAYTHLHSQYWIISPSFYIINILYNTLCFSICWQISFIQQTTVRNEFQLFK